MKEPNDSCLIRVLHMNLYSRWFPCISCSNLYKRGQMLWLIWATVVRGNDIYLLLLLLYARSSL